MRWGPFRAAREVNRFEFDPSDLNKLLEVTAWLGANRDGWVNLLPGVDEPPEPEERTILPLLGHGRPPVSMCTWMPPGRGRHALDEVTVGILHPQSRKVMPALATVGLGVPRSWKVWGDQPRRGLVIKIATTVADYDVLTWLLAAGTHLCGVQTTGDWQAEVHQPIA